jgi:hypothetical protein
MLPGAALMRDDRIDLRAAAQRGREDAAGAGTDDHVDVLQRLVEPLLQRRQGTGHPGGAEHAARTEHQADPWPPVVDPADGWGRRHRFSSLRARRECRVGCRPSLGRVNQDAMINGLRRGRLSDPRTQGKWHCPQDHLTARVRCDTRSRGSDRCESSWRATWST